MDGLTVMGLLLVFMGALLTRSVYRMGYVAGLTVARAEAALQRACDVLKQAHASVPREGA